MMMKPAKTRSSFEFSLCLSQACLDRSKVREKHRSPTRTELTGAHGAVAVDVVLRSPRAHRVPRSVDHRSRACVCGNGKRPLSSALFAFVLSLSWRRHFPSGNSRKEGDHLIKRRRFSHLAAQSKRACRTTDSTNRHV